MSDPITHFRWYNVPNGTKGISPFVNEVGEPAALTPEDAQAKINDWNHREAGTWRYEVVKTQVPPGPPIYKAMLHPTPWRPRAWHENVIVDANGDWVCNASCTGARDLIIALSKHREAAGYPVA